MKKLFSLTILIFILSFAFPASSFAQGMMGGIMDGNSTGTQGDDGHTAREEAEGKEVWEKLQNKELKCKDLSDKNFGALGEYFMGQMLAPSGNEASPSGAGSQHEAMNNMMIQMIGEEGEEQMHIAMGKRMSGCGPNAPMPQNMMDSGVMPMMMNMMMGNFATNPTSWFGWGLGWIFMILFWGFVILAIVALIKWIMNQGKREAKSKSALDILKERYAKGEIDRNEFEDKKKDLS